MFKKLTLRIITYIAILFLVDSLIAGFDFTLPTALIAVAILLAGTNLIINPAIKFFTLPVNMMTFGVFNFIISCIYLYFFNIIIPGFKLLGGHIGSYSSEIIQIPQIKISYIGVIIVSSLLISLFNSFVSWLID